MKIIYSDKHKLRDLAGELECPPRIELVRRRCIERDIGEVVAPNEYGAALPACIHDDAYVKFIAECWNDWQAAGKAGNALPMRGGGDRESAAIEERLSAFALAYETAIGAGTYEAALAAAEAAATAADLLAAGQPAFALCRPPGHHAATGQFGGFCFYNNVAVAAQRLIDGGAARVAILDTDFHQGNGTQEIFYNRRDVLYVSLHGDPRYAFPGFMGAAEETGAGAGAGYNANYPLLPNTDFARWYDDLKRALDRINDYAPDYLLVSLGMDTYRHDPLSFFLLDSDDFYTYGGAIATLRLPTAFFMEGGYDLNTIAVNTVNALEGFIDGSGK